eukprot:8661737-Ditylum_brightwellii.AAC.1
MPKIESDVGVVIRSVAQAFLGDGLEEEIQMTLNKKHAKWEERKLTMENPGEETLTYEKWKALPPSHEKEGGLHCVF